MLPLQVAASLLVVLALSAVFLYCGTFLQRRCAASDDLPLSFRAGFGFFLGMSLFLGLWRAAAFLTGRATLPLLLALLACLLLPIPWAPSTRQAAYAALRFVARFPWRIAAVGLVAPLLLFSLHLGAGSINVFASLGSLHSGRYVNVATYIAVNDRIPVLGQNIGQSMLTAVSLFAGVQHPYFTLSLWLVLANIALTSLVWGLLAILGSSRRGATLGALLVLLGNTALSLTHVLVIDSGSPFVANGYTDSLASLGTILGFLVWTAGLARGAALRAWDVVWRVAIPGALLGFAWDIYAPQNIPVALVGLGAVVAARYLAPTRMAPTRVGPLLGAAAVLAVAGLAGAFQGGMFCPASRIESLNLPGLMKVSRGAQLLAFNPELPSYAVFGSQQFYQAGANVESVLKRVKPFNELSPWYLQLSLLWCESNLWAALRTAFFPIAGLGLVFLQLRARPTEREESASLPLAFFWVQTAAAFAFGFTVVFFIELAGYKWELVRFLIPGYGLGLAALAVGLETYATPAKGANRSPGRSWVFIGCVALAVVGPLAFVLGQIYNNFNCTPAEFAARVLAWFSLSGFAH